MQWLTSTRNPSSIGNPSTVFFRSISTDGCRAARPLDLVLVDWDWVTWTWTDPSPSQGEDKVCNVIYDIILFDIGFLFKISIYISNSSLSDRSVTKWQTIALASWVLVARFRELDARGTYNFDRSGSRAGKKNRVPIRYSTARQPLPVNLSTILETHYTVFNV